MSRVIIIAVALVASVAVAQSASIDKPEYFCDLCKSYAEKALSAGQYLFPTVEDMCKHVAPKSEREECLKMLDLIKDPIHTFKPLEICTEMGFCKDPQTPTGDH